MTKMMIWSQDMLWPQDRLSILIYHRVLPQPDPLFPGEVDAQVFERHLRLLKRFFNVIPLLEATRRLRERSLPPRAACITFDDGYDDNATVALPLLQRHGLSACFFIATAYLGAGRMWNDRVIEHVRRATGDALDLSACGLGRLPIDTILLKSKAIGAILSTIKYLPFDQRQALLEQICGAATATATASQDLMMSTGQVMALHRAGMEIGAHTVNHPILATLSERAARAEILGSKCQLENIIEAPVRLFAYPNGKPGQDYGPRHVDIVRDLGFDAAVATQWGAARHDSDPFQLPRFTPWDRGRMRFLLRLRQNIDR
jgi:peptidoglycan/xylan/chitin deacetylase (PgdA/CDA1 family)